MDCSSRSIEQTRMRSDYKRIAAENLTKYGTEIDRIGKMLLANRYSDRTHFVFELLQNAEDALRQRPTISRFPRAVVFGLHRDYLEFSHFGVPFTQDHVRAICGIGESTKDELTSIGHFGIGFKSVYAFTEKPEVHSGDEHFAIESYVRPIQVSPRMTKDGQTLFRIPFSDNRAYEETLERLQLLGRRTLLFLRNIESIEWTAADGSNGTFLRQAEPLGTNVSRISLLGQSSSRPASDELERWLVFSRDVHFDGMKVGQVEIAFSLVQEEVNNEFLIQPAEESVLVVFFPTEKETHMGFLVQGPYRTTPSRDNVPKDDPWNEYLVDETAKLLHDSLGTLRDMGLLTVNAMRALPLDRLKFRPQFTFVGGDQMFAPLFDIVKESLLEEELLQAYGGGYVSGRKSKLARTEAIRELVSTVQLSALYDSKADICWLSGEITADKTRELRNYLMNELGIGEMDGDTLVSKLTEEFLRKQSDHWMSRFYSYLLGVPSLWRNGAINHKPIIRVESGEQVVPFNDKGVPMAFLPGTNKTGFKMVRQTVCKDPNSLEFLKSLGLTYPDPVDDVLINVVPNLNPDGTLQESRYVASLEAILNAFDTDSSSQRAKLIKVLSETRYVAAKNARSGRIKLVRPDQVYFPSERLVTLFGRDERTWFVDKAVQVLKGDRARRLLEATGVRNYLRRYPCETTLSPLEKRDLRVQKGAESHKREKDVIQDYDVAGLREAASRISSLSFSEGVVVARALWDVLCDTLHEARESFFSGTYKWEFARSSWETGFSAKFLRDLTSIGWVPTKAGDMKNPHDVRFSEAVETISAIPNPILQYLLEFRPETIQQLADEVGIELASIELLKKHSISSEQLSAILKQAGIGVEDNDKNTEEPKTDRENSTLGEIARAVDSMLGGDSVPLPVPLTALGEDELSKSGPQHKPSGEKDLSLPKGDKTDVDDTKQRFATFVYLSSGNNDPEDVQEFFRKEKVSRAGVDFVLDADKADGIKLVEMPRNHESYDLEMQDADSRILRYIEVKASSTLWGERGIAMSKPQFSAAQRHSDKFWLYVVENAGKPDCKLYRIQNPAGKTMRFVFDGGWKSITDTQM